MQGLKVLSLFDGMSCGLQALKQAGIPVAEYWSSEIDKYAIKIAMKNHPEILQLGDITDWKQWQFPTGYFDLIIAGSPCFVAGTKIITSTGYKNIEDIKTGDFVLTHENRFRRVLNIGFKRDSVIILKAQGIKITGTTTNHPYYIRTKSKVWDNEKRRYKRIFSEPYWKEAGNLTKDDFIGLPIVKKEENIYNLTEEDCWILGRYIADGHCRKNKRKGRKNSYQYQVILSIGSHKLQYVYSKVKQRHFSCYPHSKSVHRVVFSSQKLLELIKNLNLGFCAKDKTMMPLLTLPKSLLSCVLDGYLSGDGNFRKDHIRATSISEELIMSLNLVIAKVFNVNSGFEYTKRKLTTQIEGRKVNQKDTFSTSFRVEMKKQSNAVRIQDIIWLPIKEVLQTKLKETVYNLEVNEDNSYTANNAIVHNCQGFSIAGKMLNFDDPRSKLYFEFEEILKEYKPRFWLLENVKMKQQWKDVISERLGVQPVLINSALVSAQNRNRYYWANFEITQPEDRGIFLRDILETDFDIKSGKRGQYKRFQDKSGAICGGAHSGGNHSDMDLVGINKNKCLVIGEAENIKGHEHMRRIYSQYGKSPTLNCNTGGNQFAKLAIDSYYWRRYTPIECERLQTLQDNYTEGVSNTRRYQMTGNGWTVAVIEHIFNCMKKMF